MLLMLKRIKQILGTLLFGTVPFDKTSVMRLKVENPVVFASDIHPGCGQSEGEAFVTMMDQQLPGMTVLLVGDWTPDMVFFHLFGRFQWLKCDARVFPSIANAIQRGVKVIGFDGNHDGLIKGYEGLLGQAPNWGKLVSQLPRGVQASSRMLQMLGKILIVPRLILETEKKSVLVLHGHREYDWELEPGVGPYWDPIAVRLGKLTDKPGPRPDVSHLGRMVGALGPFPAYAKLGRLMGVDETWFGHYHTPGPQGDGTVVCASCFTNGQAIYSVLYPDGRSEMIPVAR